MYRCSVNPVEMPQTLSKKDVQYMRLIPALVDWASATAWLYKHPWITCQQISQVHRGPW